MQIKEILEDKKLGVYAGYNLSENSAQQIISWAAEMHIKNIYTPDSMHVTLAYSKKYFPFTPRGELKTPIVCKIIDIKELGDGAETKALVLTLQSEKLHERFIETRKAGAEWDFPTYIPHVTVSLDPKIDIHRLETPTFSITLIYEFSKPINKSKDWKDEIEVINE